MNLASAIDQYIHARRAASGRYKSPVGTLYALSRHCEGRALHHITAADVLRCLNNAHNKPITWQNKYGTLKVFFEYWRVRGKLKKIPMPPRPKAVRTFVPYIFSKEEVRALLDTAPECQSHPSCAIPALTLQTILLLLYGTGMRIGEVLRLRVSDVALDDSLITVWESKFFKSRLVPVGKDLCQVLRNYAQRTQPANQKDAPFFFSHKSKKIASTTMSTTFQRLRKLAGVQRRDGAASEEPRLHDLRHTFSVNRVTEWYRQGADVQNLIFSLSTYLGHVRLRSTQHYLSMTPELLEQANRRFEVYARGGCDDR
jgi:site-specific recombinase XerD